ncbi:hypothetical protein D3C73_1505070 [compost metagenome]
MKNESVRIRDQRQGLLLAGGGADDIPAGAEEADWLSSGAHFSVVMNHEQGMHSLTLLLIRRIGNTIAGEQLRIKN